MCYAPDPHAPYNRATRKGRLIAASQHRHRKPNHADSTASLERHLFRAYFYSILAIILNQLLDSHLGVVQLPVAEP